MIQRTYDKYTEVGKLTQDIINAGLPVHPDPGARFYGCVCHTWIPETIVELYDDITADEITIVDNCVAAQ